MSAVSRKRHLFYFPALEEWPVFNDLCLHHPTEGALPLRFLQGWAAMLLMQFLSVAPARLRMYSWRPFAKTAKDRHHCVRSSCNIKSLGHLP